MSVRATPYTGSAKRRQIATLVAVGGLSFLAAGLSGCATGSLPFAPPLLPQMTSISGETVGSITTQALIESVDASDWEAIRRTIAAAPAGETKSLDWSNPDTRSTGALTVGVAAEIAGSGALCRTFVTTVSDPRGVRRYRGQACRETDGRWHLKGVAADDALFS
jgi:surface antigen